MLSHQVLNQLNEVELESIMTESSGDEYDRKKKRLIKKISSMNEELGDVLQAI